MLVVNRFIVSDEPAFAARAHSALEALSDCAGFQRARLGRAADDPRRWCLVTEWESVGAYRRALSSYQVKAHATPLLAEALEEPSGYEVLATADGGVVTTMASDRAAES